MSFSLVNIGPYADSSELSYSGVIINISSNRKKQSGDFAVILEGGGVANPSSKQMYL